MKLKIEYSVNICNIYLASETITWSDSNSFHRANGPAVVYQSGYQAWYQNGKLHREDGPAIMHANGCRAWWVNGKRHREDGPAIIDTEGHRTWWIDGLLIDGPPNEN